MLEIEEIRFRGPRGGAGPTTWSQREQWDTVEANRPDEARFQLWLAVQSPPDVSIAHGLNAIRMAVERHESLRTLVIPQETVPIQQVLAEGRLRVGVSDRPNGTGPLDAGEQVRELAGKGFDPGTELPARFAILASGGRVRWLVGAITHLAVDQLAVKALERELRTLLARDRQPALAEATRQPREHAAFEKSPAGEAVLADTLDAWREGLTVAPRSLFRQPLASGSPATPRYPAISLQASGLGRRALAAARRLRVPTAAVFTAAAAGALTQAAGVDSCALIVTCANRWTLQMTRYVGTVAQQGLLPIDTVDASFDALVRRTFSLQAQIRRSSTWDPTTLSQLVDEVDGADGPTIDHFVNVARVEHIDLQGVAADLRDGEYLVGPHNPIPSTWLRFAVQVQTDDQHAIIGMFCDRNYMAPETMTQVSREIHNLVWNSAEGDVRLR